MLLTALIVVIFSLIYGYLKYHYDYWTRCGVPHERPTFVLGNLKGLGKILQYRDIHQRIYKQFKAKAPFTGMFFFFRKTALILDLDLIKMILIKDFTNFHDRGLYHNVRDDPLTGHVMNIEGTQWRSLRNKLTPLFTSGKMKFMFPTIVNVSERLVEACVSLAQADKNGAVEMKELCARYTTDVIGTCAFGLECNSLKDPNAEFRQKGRYILEKPRHKFAVQSFIFFTPEIAKFFGLKIISDEVSNFILSAVRNTVEYRLKHNIRRNDFMDLMIGLKAKDESENQHGADIDLSQGLTLEQMAAQAFVFFLAGFETSSTTMSFCLYELALSQDIQNKLREEIDNVIERNEGQLSYEAMNEMVFLDQVLDETLRKYTVLAHLLRKTIADYKVPGSNYTIEAGTTVAIPIAAIHHDPEIYPEPDKFDPTRFEPEKVKKRHVAAYLPFGDGPRSCIGMRFGKMQAKIGLITLLRHFRFTKSPLTEEPLEFSKKKFILSTKNGIYLHAEKLK